MVEFGQKVLGHKLRLLFSFSSFIGVSGLSTVGFEIGFLFANSFFLIEPQRQAILELL